MKFVKQNMVLVICGVVLLLVILWASFGNSMVLVAPFQTTVSEEYANKKTASQLAAFPVQIPGIFDVKGPPDDSIIESAKKIIQDWEAWSAEVVKMGSDANRAHYVSVTGRPPNERIVPVLNNRQLDGLLPRVTNGAPLQFKEVYGGMFELWNSKLVGTTGAARVPGTPPDIQKLKDDFDRQMKNVAGPGGAGGAGAGAGPGGFGGGFGGMVGGGMPDTKALNDFFRKSIYDRASDIHMYVDATAFQTRDWLATDRPPTEQQMFESLVDAWFQGDVVTAIAKVNEQEFARRALPPGQWNVGISPIKRLENIVVGSNAEAVRLPAGASNGAGTPAASSNIGELLYRGPAFGMSGGAVPADPNAAPLPTGPGAPNTIELSRSMTGRASGMDYDVVLMSITVDIDPAYFNKLIDQLYLQNVGYTVLNVETRTVDPLEAASNGYLYGNVQVIQVRILVEGLLFRNWTLPLMPETFRLTYGIPAPTAPAAPAPPAPPKTAG